MQVSYWEAGERLKGVIVGGGEAVRKMAPVIHSLCADIHRAITMSAHSDTPSPVDAFSAEELTALATTADALSAYLGQAVLSEVGVNEAGRELVVFGVPLDAAEASETDSDQDGEVDSPDILHVQMGGPGTRVLGNRGGLDDLEETVYDCRFLWAIELRDPEEEGFRYVKLDDRGDEVDWTDDLPSLLPFSMVEEAMGEDDLDDCEDDEDDEDDGSEPPVHIHPTPPHRH